LLFLFSCPSAHPDLHSFPTRRSSDLVKFALHCSQPLRWHAPCPRTRKALTASGVPPHHWRSRAGTLMSIAMATTFRQEAARWVRSEEHTSELQSLAYLVCRLLLEKKN